MQQVSRYRKRCWYVWEPGEPGGNELSSVKVSRTFLCCCQADLLSVTTLQTDGVLVFQLSTAPVQATGQQQELGPALVSNVPSH